MWRWRRNGPFEGRRFPRIVGRLRTLEHAPEEIEIEDYLGHHGDNRGDRDKQHQAVRVLQKLVLIETRVAARHAQQAHRVEWDEDRVNADERDPEVNFAQAFIHHAAEHLRKPEISSGKHSEDRGHTHHQVKVRRYEIGIVKEKVERCLAQHQPGNAARHKHRHEADGEKHRAGKANLCPPQRSYPVKCLDCRGHPNRQGQNRKRYGRVGTHAAHEHVVAPDKEPQHADGEDRKDHRAIAKHRLAGKGRQNVRGRAHARQNGDVHFGVAEEPEQVLPKQR